MFRIVDGRTHFYQWDTNQQLEVLDTTITEVHFSTMVLVKALVCEVREENGKRIVDVPNILLQGTWDLKVYGTCDCYTHAATIFEVKAKEKPENYVYTETEIKRYDDLEERISALENGGGSGGGLTPEQAEQLKQNTEDIEALERTTTARFNEYDGYILEIAENYAKKTDIPTDYINEVALAAKGYQTAAQVVDLIDTALANIVDGEEVSY
jgi:hypothetical protein